MGLRLAYEVWGTGSAEVLLLHGFAGNRGAWDHLRPLLGSKIRALAVDLPGHGQSPLPKRSGRLGFEDTVDALAELAAEVQNAPVQVIGYSQGARLAIGLAVRWPERVRKLVLEGGSPGLSNPEQRSCRQRQDGALAERICRRGVEAFVQEWEQRPLLQGLQRLPRALAEGLRARRLSCTPEGLAGALQCLGIGFQPDYWPRLASLRVPTLLLTGSEDVQFTETARRMAAQLPLASVCVFEGSGHAPHLESPEAYAAAVLEFLEQPSRRRREPLEDRR